MTTWRHEIPVQDSAVSLFPLLRNNFIDWKVLVYLTYYFVDAVFSVATEPASSTPGGGGVMFLIRTQSPSPNTELLTLLSCQFPLPLFAYVLAFSGGRRGGNPVTSLFVQLHAQVSFFNDSFQLFFSPSLSEFNICRLDLTVSFCLQCRPRACNPIVLCQRIWIANSEREPKLQNIVIKYRVLPDFDVVTLSCANRVKGSILTNMYSYPPEQLSTSRKWTDASSKGWVVTYSQWFPIVCGSQCSQIRWLPFLSLRTAGRQMALYSVHAAEIMTPLPGGI